MITLQQLTKRYRKKEVYDAISLEIPAGGMTLFIGQNGIGKSTLLKMIAGIEQPDAGVILYDGAQWTASERKKHIGYVPQEMALWEHMTIDENIKFFKGLLKDTIGDERITYYLEKLAIAHERQTIVKKLSGGTQRKVNLLIGLLAKPTILILDEPTVGIDLKSRTEIQQVLRELSATCTVLLTTHLVDEIEAFTDNIVLIGDDAFYRQLLEDKHIAYTKL
ncbi:ABC transporter ATP-binding protein [Kurthia huakuii]|jgi:ABC-2 type transport system ATP-binding protein|uniref:ABC transporter ATP-binding protein n=1 Tax=Kurthia huakuii TaxID=1421019 RepID=UPI00049504EC|nr:ABC transporter ATP-binding protein [Kurthia huakuii]MBM7698891.1 ABC-2 type transport system ATP-binding protein [Kurthia huakuii]